MSSLAIMAMEGSGADSIGNSGEAGLEYWCIRDMKSQPTDS